MYLLIGIGVPFPINIPSLKALNIEIEASSIRPLFLSSSSRSIWVVISLEDNINLFDNILTVTPRIIDKVQKILKHDKNNDKDVKFQEDIDKKKKE